MILSPAVVTQFADAGRKLAQHKIQLLYIKESAVHHGWGANQITPNTVWVWLITCINLQSHQSYAALCVHLFSLSLITIIYRLAVVSPYVGMVQKQIVATINVLAFIHGDIITGKQNNPHVQNYIEQLNACPSLQ